MKRIHTVHNTPGIAGLSIGGLGLVIVAQSACGDMRAMGDTDDTNPALQSGDGDDEDSQDQDEDASEGTPSDDPSMSADDGQSHDAGPSSDDESDDDDPHFDIGSIPDFDIEPEACEIDFLFVIDNSGSMAGEQDSLANSVPDFVRTVETELEVDEFQLGVVTSDVYMANDASCRQMGGLVLETSGPDASNSKCGPYADGFNFMNQNDALDVSFPCAAKPGTGGNNDERPMDAVMAALGPELGASGACNEGFIRRGGLLVITIITDEEDDNLPDFPDFMGSKGDPKQWYETVVDVKCRPENVVVLSLVGVPKPNACIGDWGDMDNHDSAELNVRIAEFTRMFGKRGFVADVCADNYGEFFTEAVSIIEYACDNLPPG